MVRIIGVCIITVRFNRVRINLEPLNAKTIAYKLAFQKIIIMACAARDYSTCSLFDTTYIMSLFVDDITSLFVSRR